MKKLTCEITWMSTTRNQKATIPMQHNPRTTDSHPRSIPVLLQQTEAKEILDLLLKSLLRS